MRTIHGFEFMIGDQPVKFRCGMYSSNRLAIEVVTNEKGMYEEPWATLTVNIPNYELEDREIIVKAWSENEKTAMAARMTGLFFDTGKRVRTGFVEAEVWKLADEAVSMKDMPSELYGPRD